VIGVDAGYLLWGVGGSVLHLVVGYGLVYLLTDWDPRWGAIGAILPDLDLISYAVEVPEIWAHRGLLHTPFFLLMLVGLCLVLGWEKRRIAPIVLGYLSHLLIDWTVPWGIMWLYPLSRQHFVLRDPTLHDTLPTIGLWLLLFGAILSLPERFYLNTGPDERWSRSGSLALMSGLKILLTNEILSVWLSEVAVGFVLSLVAIGGVTLNWAVRYDRSYLRDPSVGLIAISAGILVYLLHALFSEWGHQILVQGETTSVGILLALVSAGVVFSVDLVDRQRHQVL